MITDGYKELIQESRSYLIQARELEDQDAATREIGWYTGMSMGNMISGTAGAGLGITLGFETAEPLYQAVEATAPEAGPVIRVMDYSLSMAQAAIGGVLAHEAGQIGLHAGKYTGRYYLGAIAAGTGAVSTEFDDVKEYLNGGR